MLGRLCRQISKRSSTDNVGYKPVLARLYKLCCCDDRHEEKTSKSGRSCLVCCVLRDINYFVVVSSSYTHVFYIIVIDLYNQLYIYFCFQVTLVHSIEFRNHEIALLSVCQSKKFTQYHLLSYHHFQKNSHCIKENHFTVSNKFNVTKHVQISDCENEHLSIGHCFCEKDTFSTVKGWCKSKSKTLKCHWLRFSMLAFVLLDKNTYRNFKILVLLISLLID